MLIVFRACTANYIANTVALEPREAGQEGIVQGKKLPLEIIWRYCQAVTSSVNL